jgi:hypothetical protein
MGTNQRESDRINKCDSSSEPLCRKTLSYPVFLNCLQQKYIQRQGNLIENQNELSSLTEGGCFWLDLTLPPSFYKIGGSR